MASYSYIDSLALLAATASLMVTIINNISIWKQAKSNHLYNVRFELHSLFGNLIKITSEIYRLEHSELEIDLNFKVSLGNLRNERLIIVKQIENLEHHYPTLLMEVEYVELAKSQFALFNYEIAEKYYLKAIKKAGSNLNTYCKRYFADFLYRIKDDRRGSAVYGECIDTYDTNAGKIANGTTYRMWMNSERFNDNIEAARTKYTEAKRYFLLISEDSSRKHFISQLDLEAKGLVNLEGIP